MLVILELAFVSRKQGLVTFNICSDAVLLPITINRESSGPRRPRSTMVMFASSHRGGGTDSRQNPRLETPARLVVV